MSQDRPGYCRGNTYMKDRAKLCRTCRFMVKDRQRGEYLCVMASVFEVEAVPVPTQRNKRACADWQSINHEGS